MLKKLRRRLEEIRKQKHKHFYDFQPLIIKIAKSYGLLFPNFTENTNGSHYVYNFGVPGHLYPFTVVKEHGGRDCQSPKAAKRVIENIENVLDFIEANIPDDQESESESEGEYGHERADNIEETPRALSEPEVPDGGSGG
jgi:hypothetical protein